jgi:hypothetical protein
MASGEPGAVQSGGLHGGIEVLIPPQGPCQIDARPQVIVFTFIFIELGFPGGGFPDGLQRLTVRDPNGFSRPE